MGYAAVISLDEFREAKRRAQLRQTLHDRFERWLEVLEARVKASRPPLEQVTPEVFALRQVLTGLVTEGLLEDRYRALMDQATAPCPHCGPLLVARGPQERTVETLVGAITVTRPYFYCEPCRFGFYPLDEALGLGARRTQLDVQNAGVTLAKEVPSDTACELFEELTGLPLGVQTLHPVTNEVAEGLGVVEVSPSREEIAAKIAQVAQWCWPSRGRMCPPAPRRPRVGGGGASGIAPNEPAGRGNGGKPRASGFTWSMRIGSCTCSPGTRSRKTRGSWRR
ncbi:MAG: hypothetical protein ACK4Z6_03290 [Candidatus Methylomirabilales bacterium]